MILHYAVIAFSGFFPGFNLDREKKASFAFLPHVSLNTEYVHHMLPGS